MFRTLFDIAIRHILGRKRQTLTTMLAVSVSTMVLITTISLTRGLLDSFTETIIDARRISGSKARRSIRCRPTFLIRWLFRERLS